MPQVPPILMAVGAVAGLVVIALVLGLLYLVVTTTADVLASPKKLLVQLAARSITSHKVKSLIVGGFLTGGTFLLVFFVTFIFNTRRHMEESITEGLIGHLQVYSSEAKDTIAFFGFAASGSQDLGVIQDFKKVKEELEKIPNVKTVVPMGRDVAGAVGGNEFDDRLEQLRKAIDEHDAAKTKQLIGRLRHMVELLKVDIRNRAEIIRSDDEQKAEIESVDHALAPEFWASLETDPAPALEFLDTKIAKLQADEGAFFLPYIGTDLEKFTKQFTRFQIDTDNHSQMIPAGQRGFLFNRQFYERAAKNQVAFELDEIKRVMRDDRTTIKDSVDCQERIKKNVKQYRRITYQLTSEDAEALTAELRQELPGVQGNLEELLQAFLNVDDSNFARRYQFFYDHIGPRIRLYKVKIGDTLTLRAFTKSGYTRAINIKVFGTFHFQGIDESPVATGYNLMDIMSFRDLYGLMTPERRKELEAIKAQVGVKEVKRENAEEDLFGGESEVVAERSATQFGDPTQEETIVARRDAGAAMARPFTQDDVDNGVVLNAAVVLRDPSLLRQTLADIQKVSKDKDLHVQVIDWTTASGIVGQLIFVLTLVLLFIIAVIFVVALVIINNSMVMATMDRVIEIGMMRAIGAQRRFVRAMFMLETGVLAILAAGIGSATAAGVITLLGKTGIRAPADMLIIMFGGRWLYMNIEPVAFVVALIIVAIVGLVATFYPTYLATRIAPVVAMQRRE